ncbi:hypothetical protein JAAARDRAFT_221857 [Jaapia argillacea MUCL 33604]|uniref:RING-type domain-containing protein n=1 Tax=Jaapia argillacea MUCL 33604 TaxID=933084 RepID=A0A067QDQ5_9AGAM|nr:hypothetical protein JAAARDRAFT_221857 [Jaapia argillacea MUCL 33604]
MESFQFDLPNIGHAGITADEYRQHLLEMMNAIHRETVTPELLEVVKTLPVLTERDLLSLGCRDASCPICMTPFLALLAEEETAQVMDSPAYSSEDLGVTKLVQTCGHVFCRKDISTWIRGAHDSCPMCRTPLVTLSTTQPEETTPDPPSAPSPADGPTITDPRELLERLFMQGNLFVPMDDPSNSTSHNATNRNWDRREDHTDRSAYSGMYS